MLHCSQLSTFCTEIILLYATDLEATIAVEFTNQYLAVIDSCLLAVLAALSELQQLSPGPVAAWRWENLLIMSRT